MQDPVLEDNRRYNSRLPDYNVDHALLAIKELPGTVDKVLLKSTLGYFSTTFTKDKKAAELIDNLLYALSRFWGLNPREQNWPVAWDTPRFWVSVEEDRAFCQQHVTPALDACLEWMSSPDLN